MKVIDTKSSVLYCPVNKETGEYVTERYELTDNIYKAIGWTTKEDCLEDISNMDEPEEWTYAIKITNMSMLKDEESGD